MRSKNWKSCCQRWTSKMIEEVKNTIKIKEIFCWGWSSISSRRSPQYDGKIDEKELMPRVEPAADVRSGVLQFCRSCRSCSRAKEADWLGNIQLLSERQHFFPNFEHSFCSRCFFWSGNKDICSGRKGTLKKNYKFKRKTYCNNLDWDWDC